MREGTWDYQVVARCALADAVALLSDPERQGALHPLITKVVPEPPPAGALRSYAITDALQWGPIRFRITYHADVLSVSDREVVTVARQRPRTTLRSTARFTPEGETVRIDVTVRLQAPTPLFSFAFRTGRSAHLELAGRIREVLEGRVPI